MAVLNSYLLKKAELEKLEAEIKALENDEDFQREMAFKEQLSELMESYGKNKKDVIRLLAPLAALTTKPATKPRKKRPLKRYKNPYTQEVVETRGGNHKTIGAWKAEHGDEAVAGWATIIEE